MIARRFFLFFSLLLLLFVPGAGAESIGERFVGERAVYDIGFWLFSQVAEGEIRLERENGGYAATLTVHTMGFVDRVFRHRKDVYVAHLKEVEGGRRFVTGFLEKTIDINGRIRHGVTVVDYERRVVQWWSWGGGKDDRYGEDHFPEGIYCDDPIGAFYNFRFGVYGPAEEGRSYEVFTFPKDGKVPVIKVRILTRKEYEERMRPFRPPTDFLADVKMDKEFFGSGSGEVELYFTRNLLPVKAVAKDIAFFGDIWGVMRELEGGRTKVDPAVIERVLKPEIVWEERRRNGRPLP